MDNYGYQKTPSFSPEWNILSPQAQKSYLEFDAAIIDWMKEQYGKDIQVVIAGHSLGAREVMDLVNHYRGIDKLPENVVGFISVAGEMSGPYPDPAQAEDIPGYVFHGRNDTDISYWQSIKFVDSFKGTISRGERANQPVLRIIDGMNHTSIMTYVYMPSRDAEGYKAIRSLFTWEDYTPIECKAFLNEGDMSAIFLLPDGSVKTFGLINQV
jgi:dienelactone hydrolase